MRMTIARVNEGPKALVLRFKTLLCVLMMIASSSSLTACFGKERKLLNQTVLSINDRDISTKEFADRLALRLKSFDALQAKDETNLNRAKEETIQAFVLEVVARDYARESKLKVSDEDIEKKVSEVRSKYPDDFAFRRALADENLSIEAWKKELEFTILQKKIFTKITEKAPEPTEAELKAYYDTHQSEFQRPQRVRLRQIVLEREDDAKRVLEELEKGASLAKLAKNHSVAPEGANGGDTGWLDRGTLQVFEPAFKMRVGARSGMIKSPYGYHIYEVLKKEPESRLSFQDAKAKIRARLTELKEQQIFSSWLEQQVRKSSVRRNDELIRAIKVSTRGS
jgi:peptidyl-prolyl cis-trans isomerase C